MATTTSKASNDDPYNFATALGLDPIGNGPEKYAKVKKIPDLELGLKTSFTTKQWRKRERKLHLSALKTIQSPLSIDIRKHQAAVQRSHLLMLYGQNNKQKSSDSAVSQIRLENNLLAERLLKLQRAVTEITETNLPSRNRFVKAINDRKKFLKVARQNEQADLDYENSLLLRRLTTAKPSLSKKGFLDDFKRHKNIQKNMCRLTHPPSPKRKKKKKSKRKNTVGLGMLSVASELRLPKDYPTPLMPMKTDFDRQMEKSSTTSAALENHLVEEFNKVGLYDSEIASTLLRDRGQIFQYIADIPHVCDGVSNAPVKTFILGFRKSKVAGSNGMVIEASTDSIKRYTEIALDVLREKVDSMADEYGNQVKLGKAVSKMIQFEGNEMVLKVVLPEKDGSIEHSA